jgi:predicted HAD superfamily phosphohydrolase YqeG
MRVIGKYQSLVPAIKHSCALISDHITSNSGEHNAVFDIDDTLIFDDQNETPNIQVKHLLDVARAYGYKIHLVTARERSNAVMKWTRDELRRHAIQYESLVLAPKKSRTSMAAVAQWKHSERMKHKPVLSVGDQWGDLILLSNENDIPKFDEQHNAAEHPWILFCPNDGVTKYALKLMS